MTSQPLRIDARNGAIKTAGAARRFAEDKTIPPQAERGRGGDASGAGAPDVRQSVRLRDPPGVDRRAGREGLHRPQPAWSIHGPERDRHRCGTVTVPPAIKDHATLTRYSEAFKNYQQIVVPPADSVPSLRAVNFAIAASVAEVRRRAIRRRRCLRDWRRCSRSAAKPSCGKDGSLSHLFLSSRLDQAFDAPSALSDSAHVRSRDVFPAPPLSAVAEAGTARARDLSSPASASCRPTSSWR